MMLNMGGSSPFPSTPELFRTGVHYKVGSDKFKSKLNTEVSSYADRIASLCIEKKSAERRYVTDHSHSFNKLNKHLV